MSKRQILMLLGVWVIVLSGPGFPPEWSRVLLILTGLVIIFFGYRLKPEGGAMIAKKPDVPFTEYKRPVEQKPVAPAPPADNPPAPTGTAS